MKKYIQKEYEKITKGVNSFFQVTSSSLFLKRSLIVLIVMVVLFSNIGMKVYAAIGTGTATCTANDKTTYMSLTCTVATANFAVGDVAIMWFGGDNLDNGGNGNLLTSVTDSGGNTWIVQRCNSTALSAGSGATTCIATARITTALTSGVSTITANYGFITAKGFVVKDFTVGSGHDLVISGTPQDETSTIDPGALTISGLTSSDYLFVRGTALQRATGGVWTATTNYTSAGCNGTSGSGGASNADSCGEFSIVTATTTNTSNPTATAVNNASTFIAFKEVGFTTLATGSDPSSITIAPGGSATSIDAFTFQTNFLTDIITAVTVSLSNASSTSLVEITNDDGTTVYGSVSNPTGNTTSITLSTNTLTASTILTQYKIRITPKSQANLPLSSFGMLYRVQSSIKSWTGTNPTKLGSDTSSTTVTIDNYNAPDFAIFSASTTFASKVDYTTGTNPISIAIGDLNNDGKADLVVANSNSSSVYVFLGNGNGTFAGLSNYTTGSGPYSVAIGDLNNDGYADFATANIASNSVSVFLNNGNGTFAPKVDYTTGSGQISAAISDLNNDGYADLAVANNGTTTVSILLNNGNGTFATKVDYTTRTNPNSVAVGDFNNDGYADLAVMNGGNTVSIFLNNGNGTFATNVDYITGMGPRSVAIGDLNNDGYVDLAVANINDSSFSVLLNNGNGTFASKVDYTTGLNPISIAIGDLNNDGKADLVVANSNSSSVSVFLGNGNGTFAGKVDYTTGGGPYSVAIGDLNNDGYADLAVANYSSSTLSVLLNNSTSSLKATAGINQVTISYTTPPDKDLNSILILASTTPVTGTPVDGTTYSLGNTIGNATVACLDTTVATTTLDSCVATGLTGGTPYYFSVFVKDNYGNYSTGVTPTGSPVTPTAGTSTTITTGSDPTSSTIAPGSATTTIDTFTFQTSASTDAITSVTLNLAQASSTSNILITDNTGSTVYGSTTSTTGTTTTITLTGLTATTATITYWIRIVPKLQSQLPSGSLGMLYSVQASIKSWTGTNTQAGSDTSSTTIITIDNYTAPDFAITSASTTFAGKVDYTVGANPYSIAIGDLNNDGYADLATANNTGTSVSILLNNGNGTFATKVDYTTGTNPQFVAIGDLNNDGYADLAVANVGTTFVSIFLGKGNGTFATKVDYTTGIGPSSVVIRDLNNDGYADLVVANQTANSISILLGNGNGTFATKVDYTTGTGPRSVAIGDFNNDGKDDLATANYGTTTVSVLLGNGNGTFATKVDYTTGSNPYSVAIGDLNNDGYVDLAVANQGSSSVSVFLNNGNGTFASKVDYTTGLFPLSVAIGDLNNDGYADLMTANNVNTVSILLNNGTGTFANKVDYTTGAQTASAVIGDLNNDGKVDLAIANNGASSASILLNNSTSTLTATAGAGQVTLSYITPPDSDLNSILILASTTAVTGTPVDGTTYSLGNTIGNATVACIDSAVATSTADSCVATGLTAGTPYYFKVFVKDNYGNYSTGLVPTGSPVAPTASTATTTITTGTDPTSSTIAPGGATTTIDTFTFQTSASTDAITSVTLNLAQASSTSNILITDNTGSTVYGSTTSTTGTTTTITLTGLTATTATTTYLIRIVPKLQSQLPTGILGMLYHVQASIKSWTGTNATKSGSDTSSTTIITIDNYATSDFAITSASTSFAGKVDYTTGTYPRSVAIGDLNNDGYADIAVANGASNSVSILLGNGNGTFATKVDYTTGSQAYSVAIGDFNNDGYADLAVANFNSISVSILLNNGNGTFATKVDYTAGANPESVAIGDLNNDGYADFAVVYNNSSSVSVFLNNGNGTFATKVDYTTGLSSESVAISDLNNDGYADLVVTNVISNSLSVLLNNGNGTFATKVDYATESSSYFIDIGDLNNDGYADLTTANYNSPSVSVFLNNGNGTFATRVNYTTGSFPYSVAIGDLNNDGKEDLTVSNYGSSTASILLNNGNGTFATKVDYITGGSPFTIAIGDLNNDGYADFAVVNGGPSSVSVLLNNSTPTLTATAGARQVTISYTTPPDKDLNSILILASTTAVTGTPVDGTTYSLGNTIGNATVACIDSTVATSTADSCIATGLTAGTPYYFEVFVKDNYGNYSTSLVPTGSPATPTAPVATTTLTTGTDPFSITIAPGSSATSTDAFTFQTNSGTDVISLVVVALSNSSSTSLVEITNDAGTTVYGSVSNPIGTTTSITLSTNTLTAITTLTQYKIRITPKSQANLPIASLGMLYSVKASILSWTGNNTTKVGSDTSSTTVITIDNYTAPDFAILSASTSFASKSDYTAGSNPYSLAIGDINNDGYADIAVANAGGNSVSVFINNRNGTYTGGVSYTTGTGPRGVAIGDLNNDGYADIATANYGTSTISIFFNNGNGTFTTKLDYTAGTNPYSVVIGDLNGDGYADVAVSNINSTNVSIFLNNGNNTFASKVDYATGFAPISVAIGDLNNDGKADLAFADINSTAVSVLLGNGNGTFATKVDYTTGAAPYSVAIGDLNNDGYADLAVANYSAASVSILINNGNGTFATKVDYTTATNPYSVAIGDLNNDGYADLAVANLNSSITSTFLNNGNGTFATRVNYTAGGGPLFVAIGDLNNDGKSDLVTANNVDSSISVLLNNSTSTLKATAGNTEVTLSYITPPDRDLNSILFLASTTAITGTPVDGTTYTLGNTIGNATVACLDTAVSTSSVRSCIATGLTNGTPYYFKAFVKDNYGNYSTSAIPTGLPVTPTIEITLPVVTTSPATSITATTAILNGNITGDSGISSTIRGFAWGTVPTLSGGDTATTTEIGTFGVSAFSTSTLVLTCNTTYYFRAYAVNPAGTSTGSISPSFKTSACFPTTLGNGINPMNATIAPGSSATSTDAFTFQTNSGTDVITALTVALFNASSTSKIEITSDDGSIVYGSSTNPTGTTTSITLNNNTLTANTSLTQYKIRITPKSQTNLPIGVLGILYPVTATVSSWTGANAVAGTDATSSVLIIDNLSLPSFGISSASTTFATQATSTTGTNPTSIAVGDLNNDGYVDLAVANINSTTVSVFLNNGNGSYNTKVNYTTGGAPFSVAVGDLNNDGYVDLAVSNYGSNSVSILLNKGNGTFSTKVDYTAGSMPYSVAIGDLNNDGYADIAVPNLNSASVSVFMNNGNGTFANKVDYTTGTSPKGVAIRDLNNDGYADLSVTNNASSSVSILLNNGNGTYATKVDYTTGASPQSVAIGDFNNDGKNDLAVASWAYDSVSVLLGNGDGTFATNVDYMTGWSPSSVAIGDFNNDGYTDLAVTNYSFGSVSILLNNGNGTYADEVEYNTETSPQSVAIGDFNNDGKADLATANYGSNSISILLNNSTSTLKATAGNTEVILSYITPPDSDLNSILILASTTAVTGTPVDGTTYSLGNTIGNATVACLDTTVSTSTADSCIATGLTNGTPYYFKAYVKDNYGNYSTSVIPTGLPVTPIPSTNLGNGSNPANVTIAPGSSPTFVDSFTFQTATSSEVISALVINLSNASSTSLVEVTNDSGSLVYGSLANPIGATTSITLTTNVLTANTALTQYKIRITPKTQANLPIGALGILYPVTATVSSWTGTNPKSGVDSSSATVTIDNLPPAQVTGNSVTLGSTRLTINYTAPSDEGLRSLLTLRSTSPITDVPVDGTTYTAGNSLGVSAISCVDTLAVPGGPSSCAITSLANGIPYYIKVFSLDTHGNYSIGNTPAGSPATPLVLVTAVRNASYRFRNDDGNESSATYALPENTPYNNNFIVGDKTRVRFVISNEAATTTTKSYQVEYSTGTCTNNWVSVPRHNDASLQAFRIDPSSYVADGELTTHSSGVTAPNGKSFTPGRIQTFNKITQPITLLANEYTEIEYLLRSTGKILPDTVYCFRLTNSGEDGDFTYTQTPQINPLSRVYRYQGGGGGGGGGAAGVVEIEAPSAVATTTVTGGTVKSEADASSTLVEPVAPPDSQQSTTTPNRRRGGGGDVGLLPSVNIFTYDNNLQPMVLGVSTTALCITIQHHISYGSTDSTTEGEVSKLQYFLKRKGYFTDSITGNYLLKTEDAIRAYQKDNNLIITGITGEVTRGMIQEQECRK